MDRRNFLQCAAASLALPLLPAVPALSVLDGYTVTLDIVFSKGEFVFSKGKFHGFRWVYTIHDNMTPDDEVDWVEMMIDTDITPIERLAYNPVTR